MTTKVRKDFFSRIFFYYQKNISFSKINNFYKNNDNFYFVKHLSIVIIKNHCIFTKKSRSVFKRFCSSRIVLRFFGSNGLYIGFQKQSYSSYGGMVDTVDSKFIINIMI